MKNKKGFTLIELLAILVILAIISLIAIPVVLNIIDKVRVSSYARSADNILDATRIYFKETQIDSTMSIEGNNYNKVMESIGGRKPDSGEIYIKKNGDIALALKYSKYCYKKGYSDMEITQTESEECNLTVELDENAPTITAKETSVTIVPGASNEITSYFDIDSNGASGIKSTVCTSDKDGSVTNTSTLTANTHTITCTVTKNNNKTANASIEIIVKIEITTIADLKESTVTEGDGLYLDSDGIYRYKGLPDNYIMLGDEEYRIMAIEDQGIKVVRSSLVGDLNVPFDTYDNRPTSTNTYCTETSEWGCNIWSKASEIKQNGVVSETITNGSYSGTVIENSFVYKYLHETYYPTLSNVDKYIVKDAIWNVGPVPDPVSDEETMLLSTLKENEAKWTWSGKIGLMSPSEYLQGQLPSGDEYTACSLDVYNNSLCGTNNWLYEEYGAESYMFINPRGNYTWYTTVVFFDGAFGTDAAIGGDFPYALLPVVYLNSSIQLTGTGIQGTDPYRIVES